jgi:DNA repair exonuclease SbcCD ATPase subunit
MKQGGSGAATILPESNIGPTLSVVELPQHREEVDSKLDQAREHLLTLRRQQEELERQKSELEELRRKQEEYSRGRAEITDNLARGLLALERQQIESQRLAELSGKTIAAFRDYAEQIQQINDADWNSGNVRSELSRALGVLEGARLEYNRARSKLDCLNPAAGQDSEAHPAGTTSKAVSKDEILRYACLGAAASAPLILAGTIWLIALLTVKH